MPNALLEAMACGLAPIVTDASPGPLECVRPDQTGLVVASENASALAAAMLRLARDDDLTDRLARQAAAYVKEHDWEVVEQQWLTVLGMANENDGETKQFRPPQRAAV
jgi:glycosyltransferase involved in cell wall biosynthesis